MDIDAIFDLARTIVLIIVAALGIRMIVRGINKGNEKGFLRLIFFTIALLCLMFSELYWLIYDIMRPEERMPFAANEISEAATFLLLGVVLTCRHTVRMHHAKTEMTGAILFTCANVCFWIGWSGEIVQDILTGVVLAFFLCSLVRFLKCGEVLSKAKWCFLGISCAIIVAGETGTFLINEPLKEYVDWGCYAWLFIVAVVLTVWAVRSMLKGENALCNIGYSFLCFAWSVAAMYMSDGVHYTMAMMFSAVCFVMMLLALKKEAEADDIR